MESDSKKTFTFTLKEILIAVWFILILGVSIGGFVKMVGDVEVLSKKVDKVSDDLNKIQVTNGQLLVLIKGKDAIGH